MSWLHRESAAAYRWLARRIPRLLPSGKKAAKKTEAAKVGAPDWFRARPGPELLTALGSGDPVYLYVPWIASHGDRLIQGLHDPRFRIAPLDLVSGIETVATRRAVGRFARVNPDRFRALVLARLLPIRSRITGILLTLDWMPTMRLIANACHDLDIPTILIPHESAFANEALFYRHIPTGACVPTCDVVLGWGMLQQRIFAARGYDPARFVRIGAPKFDAYHGYVPIISRAHFMKAFAFDPDRRLILFAMQPLDSQFGKDARDAQRRAARDLARFCVETGRQLLIRLPPSGDEMLGEDLRHELALCGCVGFDEAGFYRVPPEEAIHHADLVVSVNSTMLFEALLMGRPSITLRYTDFDPMWTRAGVPSVEDIDGFRAEAERMLSGGWARSEEGLRWAAEEFSTGGFDGQATRRIVDFLADVADGTRVVDRRPTPIDRVFARQPIDVVAIHSPETKIDSIQRHVAPMLKANRLVHFANPDVKSMAELFIEWGVASTPRKDKQRIMARALGRQVLHIEDGFIRSVGIGLSGEPTLSIIIDDRTAYYDATRPSRLSARLESGPDLTAAERERAQRVRNLIVGQRISKYNHAPDRPVALAGTHERRVLVVDQRFGDRSVEPGLAGEASFDAMLDDARALPDTVGIVVKQHPDAIGGGKGAYFTKERLEAHGLLSRAVLIDFDVNPHALFDVVDDVWVVTSGLGFEAVLAGKSVRCYGMPFYAGWGVTEDRLSVPFRTRRRDVEDILHAAYIEFSRYYSPKLQQACEVEDVIDYIAGMRQR